jgi:hypothetical protein
MPPGAAGAAQSGAVGGGDLQLMDDAALARALQDEYDREHSDLRQHANLQQQPDYRTAGYPDLHASTMPTMVPVDLVYYYYYYYYCCCCCCCCCCYYYYYCYVEVVVVINYYLHFHDRRRAQCAKE